MSDNREQMDIHEVAELLGKSWQTVRYYKTSANPIPCYKRAGDWIHVDGVLTQVARYMKGTRLIFLRSEVLQWKKDQKL